MHKFFFLLTLFTTSSFAFAQALDFTFADPQPELVEMYGGSLASGDIDGDGDVDLLMSGISPRRETEFYLNDGEGNFTPMEDLAFPRTAGSVTQLEDLDGDGDLDLFLAGSGFSVQELTHVYLNDGQGGFTLQPNPGLPVFWDSGADLADVDGDGDKDLLVSVKDKSGAFIADVYLNDGNAVFTPVGSTVFTGVRLGKVKFLDADNDGDADAIVSGKQENDMLMTTLYLNDGTGNFSVSTNSGLLPLIASDIDVADTDNDGDIDVLISGSTDNVGGDGTFLYLNDGTGVFTALASSGLQQVSGGGSEIEDFDNDGDLDIILVGTQAGGLPNIYVIVYENEGENVFTPVDTLGGEYIATSIADDFDGDGFIDFLVTGFVDKTSFYWNTSGTATSVSGSVEMLAVTMYPNPSAGQLTIELGKDIPNLNIAIYSAEGKRVYEQSGISGIRTDLQLDLKSGTYIVQLRSTSAVATRKLLILR